MMGATTKRRKLSGTATTSRGAARPVRLDDRGAIAFEFALVFPVLMLMFAGIFGMGVVMIEDMQLFFVVESVARASQPPGTFSQELLVWAKSQLPSATFSATPPCITGQWPISLGVFPDVTLKANACWAP